MGYLFILIFCFVLMGAMASFLFYLGNRISYSYILYNPSITLGFGIIFFLSKMIFLHQNSVDVIITAILMFVWIIALLEAVIIDVFETGEEMFNDTRLLIKKMNLKEMKIVVITTLQHWKRLLVKNKKPT